MYRIGLRRYSFLQFCLRDGISDLPQDFSTALDMTLKSECKTYEEPKGVS
jgi:hypothetical protein